MGKGATFQQFVATVGVDTLEIDVAPWGEGHLRVNGREIAQVKDRKDRRQAFRDLKQVAALSSGVGTRASEGRRRQVIAAVKATLRGTSCDCDCGSALGGKDEKLTAALPSCTNRQRSPLRGFAAASLRDQNGRTGGLRQHSPPALRLWIGS
jgi:hypothetical protein